MKKGDIIWADWHRILVGNAPDSFLLEVLIRTIFLYLFLLLTLRLMGKRMGGQLTISELAVMLTLGAIICVPMQIPDKGILLGFMALLVALAFQRWFNLIGFKSGKAEELIHGTESMLIKDGQLVVSELKKMNISRQQLYAILRSQQVYNLGEIERTYIEACGLFSVFKFKHPQPGLSLLPTKDEGVHRGQQINESILVCRDCGRTQQNHLEANCANCGCHDWEKAVL
jgi:uncharacterized membrane protein YcaP (DUF421 family)